ncbi:MAG: Gfo/Idh/MocA family protein [Planctomycetaceae bacterium]
MNHPLRIGVLGCARIARKSVIPAILATDGCKLAAIASRRTDAAAEWAAEFGAAKSFDSYDDLLADPAIDAVYIPATGDQHYALTMAAAAAGKHVLCEKPLATSTAEARQMVAACRDAGLLLMEAFMWRHHPRTLRTRELLADGAIGELRLINVSFSFPLDPADWRMHPERGGGAMWDIGCYGVDAARLFTGSEPVAIDARAHFADTGIDLSMTLGLRFPGDVLANIDCSFEVPWRCRLELVGSTGRIEWGTAFQHWDPTIRLFQSSDCQVAPEIIDSPTVSQYESLLLVFRDSVRAGRLQAPAEDGLANMYVLEMALQRSRER